MAKRPAKEAPQGKKASMALVWGAIIFGGLVVISPETVLLLSFGLSPTIVAFIIDRTAQKHAAFCVGGMNFSGIFSYVLDLWSGGYGIRGAVDIITDPFAILVIFSAAAFGWLVFMGVPPVVSAFITVMAQRRVALLRASQKELIQEWGESVANPEEVVPGRAEAPAALVEVVEEAEEGEI